MLDLQNFWAKRCHTETVKAAHHPAGHAGGGRASNSGLEPRWACGVKLPNIRLDWHTEFTLQRSFLASAAIAAAAVALRRIAVVLRRTEKGQMILIEFLIAKLILNLASLQLPPSDSGLYEAKVRPHRLLHIKITTSQKIRKNDSIQAASYRAYSEAILHCHSILAWSWYTTRDSDTNSIILYSSIYMYSSITCRYEQDNHTLQILYQLRTTAKSNILRAKHVYTIKFILPLPDNSPTVHSNQQSIIEAIQCSRSRKECP